MALLDNLFRDVSLVQSNYLEHLNRQEEWVGMSSMQIRLLACLRIWVCLDTVYFVEN